MSLVIPPEANKCPFCRNKMKSIFKAKDYRITNDDERWDVVWCNYCGYGKVSNDLTPEVVAQFYRTEYYTHQADLPPNAQVSFLDKVRIHLAWRFDKGTDFSPAELGKLGSFCDIGCGNGGNLRKFKEAGFQVVGVEPDQDARSVASKESVVYDGTGESLPASLLGQQDYVLLSHVLEHTISPAEVLKNIYDLLKQNGVLVVEVPNNSALGFEMFRELWPWTDAPRHIHYFTESSLCKLLDGSGFKVSKIQFVGYTRQFRNEWIEDQRKIWRQVGDKTKKQPNFQFLAWRLLAKTFLASKNRKYDSIRIHAVKVGD